MAGIARCHLPLHTRLSKNKGEDNAIVIFAPAMDRQELHSNCRRSANPEYPCQASRESYRASFGLSMGW